MIYIRGAGDLASGVALRLYRAGIPLVMSEIAAPLAVRRAVAFSEAVYAGRSNVEGVEAVRVEQPSEVPDVLAAQKIPVAVDPEADWLEPLNPDVLIDARMQKQPPDLPLAAATLVVGLGPGFTVGLNCHAVVETMRGHYLGRVLWHGSTLADTGEPDSVMGYTYSRVFRATAAGQLQTSLEIGETVDEGQGIGTIDGQRLTAPIGGVVRGILRSGSLVDSGLKIGDIDPRLDRSACFLVSDKSLAIGGGVLEAVLSWPELRARLWH